VVAFLLIATISLFDSYYHANRMKVQNLLGTYAFKCNIVFSTRVCKNIKKEKYPDMYIFLPKKGIEIRRPVMGLNFVSLYFNFIMAYNFSLDKIILMHREANITQNNGNNLYKIKFPFNNRIVQA